jgi:C_GCAxxG_C_C family probable redox protein
MSAADLAVERFGQGYSCSQSVFSVCAERRGVDRDLSFRISAGLGGGIAQSAETCGCITGAVLAIGLAQPDVSPEQNKAERQKTYEKAKRFLSEFNARHGSLDCRDLLGCDLSQPGGYEYARDHKLFESRCRGYVRDAVEIVEGILSEGS